MAEQKRSEGKVQMFTILQLLEGGQAEYDEAAERQANTEFFFDTRDTPGHWVNDKWVTTKLQ